jgi:beta-lactamase class A
MVSRRRFVAMTALSLPGLVRATQSHFTDFAGSLAMLERTNDERLGVAILDTSTGERSNYRADARFSMCSTFKFLLAAAVLQRLDRHQETVDRVLPIPPSPLLSNSPLTEPHVGGSMTIGALSQAIIKLSLNEALDGDPRDTTSPTSMLSNLKAVLLDEVLSVASRNQLRQWMEASVTGLSCLRAGVPPHWRVADKTGSNGSHTRNDIAVIWPPGRPPIIVTAYLTQCTGPESKRDTLLANIGKLLADSRS